MKNTIPEVDAYIEKSADFAGPILTKLRAAIHKANAEIEEAIKWKHPCYSLQGLVCGTSAHKAHVNFTFFKGSEMPDPEKLFFGSGCKLGSMKFEALRDLPSQKVLVAYIKAAINLNQSTTTGPKKKAAQRPAPKTPVDLQVELDKKKNSRATATFEGFSPSQKREYVEWITEAKREATRQKRLAQAIEWMNEGKTRNWKYKDC